MAVPGTHSACPHLVSPPGAYFYLKHDSSEVEEALPGGRRREGRPQSHQAPTETVPQRAHLPLREAPVLRGWGRGLAVPPWGSLDVRAGLPADQSALRFRDFMLRVLSHVRNSCRFGYQQHAPTCTLMLSSVCFRYRNCVYTYRILPEDDKFTVQVSP